MSVLEAIIMGILQGLTEFLPVSSSGHLEIANYLGGRPVYLPRGDALKRALRDRRIWRDSGKVSPDDLATREGLCMQQVYKIIGEMRALEKRRRQPGLF